LSSSEPTASDTINPDPTIVELKIRKRPTAFDHTRVDTTQIYATIRPAQLKRAVSFYEDTASQMLGA
jgi:hypothetical protein